MNLYTHFARNILLPSSDFILSTKMYTQLNLLEKSQWWSSKELQDYQNKKLRNLINHSYKNVPYYHNIFKKLGIYPDDIRTKEDLRIIPVLTKDILRENFLDLQVKNIDKWNPIADATSGSTGMPLRYFIDNQSYSSGWACAFRGWGFGRYEFGDKRATLGGASLIPLKKLTLEQLIRAKLERNLLLSAVHVSNKILNGYLERLNEFKPKFLRGYPSAWYSFALFLEKNPSILKIKPRAVFTTAEMLDPHQRKVIENIFGEVFDGYGCRDGGASAFECDQHSGYHISVERSVMEFIKNSESVSDGEEGNILLTDLDNYAMPFIRYEVGDIGIPSSQKCPCGRGLPLMSSIIGRTTDILEFKNGVTLSGPALTLIFKSLSIKQYQIIKEKNDRLLIKIIKGIDYSQNDEAHILKLIRAHVGNDVEVSIEYVSEIALTKAGKFKFILNN